MNKAVINNSERLYSIFLKFYPKNYRQEFGEEMKFVYSESIKDAYMENGVPGIIVFWKRSFTDGVKSFFIQHLESQKGGDTVKTKNTDIIMQNKVFLWIALATGLLLMIPFMSMKLNLIIPDPGSLTQSGFDWTLFDFIVMGILLFGMGSLFVVAARRFSNNRLLVGLAIAVAFLLIWVHLAVGIVDSWPFAGS